jgi:hypothetical protein
MKKILFCIACIASTVFVSCVNGGDIDQELAKIQKEQVEKEYDSLPNLSPLTLNNLADSTNFNLADDKNIAYKGKEIYGTDDAIPLYGSGDMMLLSSGKMFMILHKDELNIDPMAYPDYTIIGVKAKTSENTLYMKGDLNGKTIFVKYVAENGKPFHVYVYGY